jgi:hypothetical protein
MMSRRRTAHRDALPPSVVLLFAPLDKRALGVAVGSAAALAMFALTSAYLLLRPSPAPNLALLAQYFPGYGVSWRGAFIGSGWAFLLGFCAGWLLAFTRNFVIAAWIFLTRSRTDMAAARDFLDHV